MMMERRVVPDDAERINLDRCYAALERQQAVTRRTQALLAAAGEGGEERRWFVLRTDHRADKAVDKALGAAGIERWMPVAKVTPKPRPGRKGPVPTPYDKPVLPGYVFVRIVPTAHAWAGLRTIDGVLSVLGGFEGAVCISNDRLLKLKAFIDDDPEAIATLTNAIRKGERVMIEDGPFARFTGFVEEVSKGRALVEVMMFGRATPLELELAQLSKIL